ncbi:MAG: HAD-IA family hydrolase, partial [Boseongicola sp.]
SADPIALNRAWEKLDPWPDVCRGLNALKELAIIAPCSNGSIALMTRLAKYCRLPWDCILGADIARNYKPSPDVYLASARALRLEPQDVLMVAAHNDDLVAARSVGMRTAFVPRRTEHGPDQTTDLAPEHQWDVLAEDFLDLAHQVAASYINRSANPRYPRS